MSRAETQGVSGGRAYFQWLREYQQDDYRTHVGIVNDFRIKSKWSDPKVLKLVQYHFNSSLSSEAGLEPFKAMFGSADEIYYRLDPDLNPKDYQTSYVKELDRCL